MLIRKEQPMARDRIDRKNFMVHIEGFDRILALKSQVEVPLSHVIMGRK
jgi:hypothetical protein